MARFDTRSTELTPKSQRTGITYHLTITKTRFQFCRTCLRADTQTGPTELLRNFSIY